MNVTRNPDPDVPQGMVPDERAKRLARGERVLTCLQHTLNHDLPNQLVALQGLLQMLDLEEQARLSSEGKDYLRRLTGITQRMQSMVSALKAVSRAALEPPRPGEEVSLAEAAEELAAEVKQLFLGRDITYHLQFGVAAVRAPRQALHRALVEVVAATVQAAPPGPVRIALVSAEAGAAVELILRDCSGRPSPATPTRGDDPFRGAGRLGLVLARELADAWGGGLRASAGPGLEYTFFLLVPPL